MFEFFYFYLQVLFGKKVIFKELLKWLYFGGNFAEKIQPVWPDFHSLSDLDQIAPDIASIW